MSKLGYTWYPKDWGNSEAVFELNLSQRGLYRELIDLAMLNDNKTIIKLSTWSRKFGVSESELKIILGQLSHLDLIKLTGEKLFIPSCEPRLNLVRGGSKGGRKSKPSSKPDSKPSDKPDSNQRESKEKVKEIKEKVKEIKEKVNKGVHSDKIVFLTNWLEYRKNIKKAIIVNTTLTALKNRLNAEPVEKCKWVINHSIENGYQGLFWDKYKPVNGSNGQPVRKKAHTPIKRGSYER